MYLNISSGTKNLNLNSRQYSNKLRLNMIITCVVYFLNVGSLPGHTDAGHLMAPEDRRRQGELARASNRGESNRPPPIVPLVVPLPFRLFKSAVNQVVTG